MSEEKVLCSGPCRPQSSLPWASVPSSLFTRLPSSVGDFKQVRQRSFCGVGRHKDKAVSTLHTVCLSSGVTARVSHGDHVVLLLPWAVFIPGFISLVICCECSLFFSDYILKSSVSYLGKVLNFECFLYPDHVLEVFTRAN